MKSLKILLIEDDDLILDLYERLLTQQGFEVDKAVDGDSGLAKAKQELPDVILLDILLPGKSGIEVLHELKTDEATAQIPVVILTNYAGEQYAKQSLDGGATGYIIKSSQPPNEIVKIVRDVCGEELPIIKQDK
jgi:CheY-like chemotaxis protein